MSLFDALKRQAAQAARSAANQAGQNIVQGAKNAVSGMGNKTYKVTLQQLPVNHPKKRRRSLLLLCVFIPWTKRLASRCSISYTVPRGLVPMTSSLSLTASGIRTMFRAHILTVQLPKTTMSRVNRTRLHSLKIRTAVTI